MSQTPATAQPISPLRRRMIEDMTIRGFGEKTQSDYIRHVKNFTIFLGRSPDMAEGEDLRAFQVRQRQQGGQPPTMNGAVAALRVLLHDDVRPARDGPSSEAREAAAEAARGADAGGGAAAPGSGTRAEV